MSTLAAPDTTMSRGAPHSGPRKRARRVGVLYPSGWGNLGDEAILQSTFAGLRELWPGVEIRAFTLHPERTATNHHVEAEQLTGINRPMFHAPRNDRPAPIRAARRVAAATTRIPLARDAFRFVADLTEGVFFESRAIRSAWRWLQSADLVLAAGGGQLDAVWGGAWGQPYALARWAWLTQRAGVPFAFLSVGFGTAPTWLSRTFMRFAVRRASYCSMRDAGSRALTQQLGIDRDLPVVPDLAFALSCGERLALRRPGFDVGISPMVYLRPGSWPREDKPAYERMVQLWAELTTARVARGDRVHFFVSDPGDMSAVWEVWAKLCDETRARCHVSQAETPNQLLEFYRGVDVVVSSRLHGVLLALVAGRPVVALSHERKVRAVMSDANVAEFCSELTSATPDQVDRSVDEVLRQLETCGKRVADYAASARAAIGRQVDMLPDLLRAAR